MRFLSKTLPVLTADDTLPKVTQVQQDDLPDGFDYNGAQYGNRVDRRMGRSPSAVSLDNMAAAASELAVNERQQGVAENRQQPAETEVRVARKFCDGGGV